MVIFVHAVSMVPYEPELLFVLYGLSEIGLGVMQFKWLSTRVLVVPILHAFLRRIAIEERALLAAFGADHAAYRGRTKRLVPFIH